MYKIIRKIKTISNEKKIPASIKIIHLNMLHLQVTCTQLLYTCNAFLKLFLYSKFAIHVVAEIFGAFYFSFNVE